MRASGGALVRSRRRLMSNLALLAVVIALCFLGLELGLRLVFGDPQPFLSPQVRHVPTDWGFKTQARQQSFTGSMEVVTNGAGYRDKEWPTAKGGNVVRILAIGDSITFGNLVAQQQTFAARLARQVEVPGKVEWLTAAVGGWNTIEEKNFLEKEGLNLKPDLVVLFFFYNHYDTESQVRNIELSDDGRVEGRPSFLRWLSYDLIFLLKRSAVIRLGRDLLDNILNEGDYRSRFNSLLVENKVDLDADARIQTTYRLLADMQHLAKAAGAEFMLVFCPSLDIARGKGAEPDFIGHLTTFMRSLGGLVVDATPAFRASRNADALFMFPWDNHYSVAGHDVLARTVAPAVIEWLSRRQ